jgi:CubicO group peptidase (beta-lactamase class C family)
MLHLLAPAMMLLAASSCQPAGVAPAASPVAAAPVGDAADLSGVLAGIVEKRGVPGMAALVLEGDRVVARGAAGVRKSGFPDAIAVTDTFHLGSCTKSMTATMIGTLVDEGKLRWTSTVGEVFPDLPMHAQWKGVTLEQLLTNCSGAPSDLSRDGLWSRLWGRRGSPTEQRMQLVEAVTSWAPEFEPGTRFLYSNAGFAIAGAMAEKVTGVAWEDLMRQRLFEPLGMTSAGFGPPGERGSIDQPRGHRENGTPMEPGREADNPPAIGPAATVHCTLDDWAKYTSLHLKMDRVCTPATFEKLHTPMKMATSRSDYAMGWGRPKRSWAMSESGNGRVLTHNGSNTMWFCVVWAAPEKNFAVLVACNKGGKEAEGACDDAAGALIAWRREHFEKKPEEKATP